MATRNIENVPEALAKRLKGQAALRWAKPEPRGHRCLETVAQDAPLDPDSGSESFAASQVGSASLTTTDAAHGIWACAQIRECGPDLEVSLVTAERKVLAVFLAIAVAPATVPA